MVNNCNNYFALSFVTCLHCFILICCHCDIYSDRVERAEERWKNHRKFLRTSLLYFLSAPSSIGISMPINSPSATVPVVCLIIVHNADRSSDSWDRLQWCRDPDEGQLASDLHPRINAVWSPVDAALHSRFWWTVTQSSALSKNWTLHYTISTTTIIFFLRLVL